MAQRFITPNAAINAINGQQHARQNHPLCAPVRRSRSAPRYDAASKICPIGERQCCKHRDFSGVS